MVHIGAQAQMQSELERKQALAALAKGQRPWTLDRMRRYSDEQIQQLLKTVPQQERQKYIQQVQRPSGLQTPPEIGRRLGGSAPSARYYVTPQQTKTYRVGGAAPPVGAREVSRATYEGYRGTPYVVEKEPEREKPGELIVKKEGVPVWMRSKGRGIAPVATQAELQKIQAAPTYYKVAGEQTLYTEPVEGAEPVKFYYSPSTGKRTYTVGGASPRPGYSPVSVKEYNQFTRGLGIPSSKFVGLYEKKMLEQYKKELYQLAKEKAKPKDVGEVKAVETTVERGPEWIVEPAPQPEGFLQRASRGLQEAEEDLRQRRAKQQASIEEEVLKGFVIGAGQGAASIGQFGVRMFKEPKETVKSTGRGLAEVGRRIVTGYGFPEVGQKIQTTPTGVIVGRVTTELATIRLAGAAIQKASSKIYDTVVALKTRLSPRYIRATKITPEQELIYGKGTEAIIKVPSEKAGKTITLKVVRGYKHFTEPLSKQVSRAGTTRDLVTAQKGLYGKFTRTIVVEKPVPTGGSQLERGLFFDPSLRVRPSRLGIVQSPRQASVIDILSGDVSFIRPKPQIVLVESQKIASYPKSMTVIKGKLLSATSKGSATGLTGREIARLTRYQLSRTGQPKVPGFLTTEPEVILAPGEVMGVTRTIGTTILKGKRIKIYGASIAPVTSKTAATTSAATTKTLAEVSRIMAQPVLSIPAYGGVTAASIVRPLKRYNIPVRLPTVQPRRPAARIEYSYVQPRISYVDMPYLYRDILTRSAPRIPPPIRPPDIVRRDLARSYPGTIVYPYPRTTPRTVPPVVPPTVPPPFGLQFDDVTRKILGLKKIKRKIVSPTYSPTIIGMELLKPIKYDLKLSKRIYTGILPRPMVVLKRRKRR